MKQFDLLQAKENVTGLFAGQNKEPVLIKNQTGSYFLVLPLERMNWQEIFFQLYQLPGDLLTENGTQKRDMSKIEKICGSFKNYLSSSEEFAKNKQYEIDLEEQKWKK
jgi:hypothetical protein